MWPCRSSRPGRPLWGDTKPPTAIGYGKEEVLEFGYRKWESVRTHVNRFNGGQTTHKTGPRGGKIKSTVYKDWVAAHGGEWVGFQWRPL